MSSLARRLVFLLLVVFAAINLGNALHKGGDFEVFLEAGGRVIDGQPLYEHSAPGAGVIGPPFQGVFFVPFAALARVNVRAADVAWYLLNLAALTAGVWWWTAATDPRDPRQRPWLRAAVVVPLAAIVLPAETNFEHQNMNALLLGITGASAWAWARGRSTLSGALVGFAAALKAFPALLLVVFVVRRDWRALAGGVATGVVLSATPALRYGASTIVPIFRRWLDVSADGGWPTRIQNQSIVAMAARAVPGVASIVSIPIIAILIGLLVWATWRSAQPAVARTDAGPVLALGLAVAVLASPIAWDHYWVLMFPALQAIFFLSAPPGLAMARTAFWIAAALVSGLAPVTIGERGFDLARSLSNSTLAGVIVVVTLATTLGGKRVRR